MDKSEINKEGCGYQSSNGSSKTLSSSVSLSRVDCTFEGDDSKETLGFTAKEDEVWPRGNYEEDTIGIEDNLNYGGPILFGPNNKSSNGLSKISDSPIPHNSGPKEYCNTIVPFTRGDLCGPNLDLFIKQSTHVSSDEVAGKKNTLFLQTEPSFNVV